MQKLFFLSFLMLTAVVSGLRAQDCPRIFQRGDTLYTDPAPQYQWFRDNNPINGANKQWYLPTSKGNYGVEVSATAPKVSVNPNLGRVIAGRIIDERYEPIADATISVGQFNTKSDATGAFRLENIKILTENAVVTITKAGFWKNVQHVHFFDPSFAPLTAMLEPLKITNRFDAQKGATISERGFFLTFPPNSAVTEDGKTYQGTIALSLKRSFPSEDGFGLRMPGGDFSAIDQNGQEKMLVSYGFMSAEMQGSRGEKLRLAPDTEATLEFYIPWEQNKTAPDSMPLWHFDETTAVWQPEGIARKVGPRYVGTVKHFSSWNCDYPKERATVMGKVVDCKGNPIPYKLVDIGERSVTTNGSGLFERFVPTATSFYVTAGMDTIFVDSLNTGEVKDVGKIISSSLILDAIGLIDSTGMLTVYGYRIKEYSADNGKTFHPKTERLTFTEKYPIKGITKDSLGCEANFYIYIIPKLSDCQLLDRVQLANTPTFRSINGALAANETVYQFDFQGNFIGYPEMMSAFSCLQRLYLNSNQLSNAPEFIKELANLQWLELSSNQLTDLPQFIGEMPNLKWMVINGNKFKNIPKCIMQMTNLKTLTMRDNQLTNMPESIGQMTNLTFLDLTNNQLTNVPDSIGQLTNLTMLSLTNNQLTNMPVSIGQMTNLTMLSLGDNQFTYIPESIGQVPNLTSLNLSRNGLTIVPEFIGQLTNLQSLDLSDNPLTSLPESIKKLKDTLKYLYLVGNPITEEEEAKIKSWLPNTNILFF